MSGPPPTRFLWHGLAKPVHLGAVALAVAAGASGVALVWWVVQAGAGADAVFPLLLLWFVAVVVAVRLGQRVAGALRRGRGNGS